MPQPSSVLAQMRSQPQIMQLVALARQNPAMLPPLLEELARQSPQALQLILNLDAAMIGTLTVSISHGTCGLHPKPERALAMLQLAMQSLPRR